MLTLCSQMGRRVAHNNEKSGFDSHQSDLEETFNLNTALLKSYVGKKQLKKMIKVLNKYDLPSKEYIVSKNIRPSNGLKTLTSLSFCL